MFKLNMLLLITLCLTLVGCAATTAQNSNMNSDTNMKTSKYDIDWEYVAKVERNNRGSALPGRVIWVNPPMKEVANEG